MRRLIAALASAGLMHLSSRVDGQVAYQHMRADGRDIREIKIADGIYQFMTQRDSYVRQLNSVVVINDSDVLVFDTGTRPSSTRLILDRIRQLTSKPVRYVVNSHWHPDHVSSNQVYADAFPNVEVIATSEINDSIRSTASVWAPRFAAELETRRLAYQTEVASGKLADGTALTEEQRRQDKSDLDDYATLTDETASLKRVFPTRVYRDSMSFVEGRREFRFISVMGDAGGTTVLYLPRERVLITGDAVSYPIPFSTGALAEHVASLRMLASLGATVIIPGHGPAFRDNAFIDLETRFLQSILDEMAKARASGVTTVEEMQKVVTVEPLRDAFAHGDPDLDARYRSRVSALVALAMKRNMGDIR